MKDRNEANAFGERLCALRNEWNVISQDVAGRVGVLPSYYCDIEKGRRIPSQVVIAEIVRAIIPNTEVLRRRMAFNELLELSGRESKERKALRSVYKGKTEALTIERGLWGDLEVFPE